jgi:hypothetical protein
MPTMIETASNGKTTAPGLKHRATTPPASLRRRRQVPWIVAGVLLVVGCALAFGVASVRASHGEVVLAVAQPVPAGQVVEANDLRAVRMSPLTGVQPVLLSNEASVVGHPAAVGLVAGTLLTLADIGVASPGSASFDVVAMALKAGAYPPSLGAGESVEVVPVAGGSSSGASASPVAGQADSVRAVIVGIETAPAGSSVAAVVSLQVSPSDAAEVAALGAAGDAVLVGLPSGSGS